MPNILHHLFLPHESNNHRPKILHHQSLFLLIVFFIFSGLMLTPIRDSHKSVLGISANIAITDLLSNTNRQRVQNGLSPLSINTNLDSAAQAKAQYMFAHHFWAHNDPVTGLTPWSFIKNSGYQYVYAGENLAEGYETADDVVSAWMASPGHRANILSQNYNDVGFAVMAGNLVGEDTVLVVQMFGSQNSEVASAKTQDTSQPNLALAPSMTLTPSPIEPSMIMQQQTMMKQASPAVAAVQQQPLVNTSSFSKNLGSIVLLILITVLVLDLIYIRRKQVTRIVAHNLDHILFLGMILLLILLVIGKGLIL